MDGGYPLQMDFSPSSSSKRFWDLWSGHGQCFFCILGPALSVVGLRGDFKRGIIWNGEDGMKAIYHRMLQWSLRSVCKTPQRCPNAWASFEKAACTSFAQISPNPSHLNLSPPQSACQQINTIRKDNSAGPVLTVISQISERPREDTSPKPRLSPQI